MKSEAVEGNHGNAHRGLLIIASRWSLNNSHIKIARSIDWVLWRALHSKKCASSQFYENRGDARHYEYEDLRCLEKLAGEDYITEYSGETEKFKIRKWQAERILMKRATCSWCSGSALDSHAKVSYRGFPIVSILLMQTRFYPNQALP